MSISAVIIARNEEKNIASCLKSLSWCSETIVIDDNSIDNTTNIARKSGAKVFVHSLNNNFSQQRNFGLSKAASEWILFIDVDETVSPFLQKEMLQVVGNKKSSYTGFFIKRQDFMWGKKLSHGETKNIWLMRLAKKDAGQWSGKVHETWNISGKVGRLKNPLDHFPHATIKEFLVKINFYSTLRAEELYHQGVRSSFISILFYTKGKFFVNYFVQLGFVDGVAGLLVSLLMSFHSFLTRGKLWLIWQNQTKSLQ